MMIGSDPTDIGTVMPGRVVSPGTWLNLFITRDLVLIVFPNNKNRPHGQIRFARPGEGYAADSGDPLSGWFIIQPR